MKRGVGSIAKSREAIEKQFDKLRQNLLDLTMRNQLLNFRPRTRVIPMVNENPEELYDLLVLNEKKLQFRPLEFETSDRSVMDTSRQETDVSNQLSKSNLEPDRGESDSSSSSDLENEDSIPNNESSIPIDPSLGEYPEDNFDDNRLDDEFDSEDVDIDANKQFLPDDLTIEDSPESEQEDIENQEESESQTGIYLKEVYDAKGMKLSLDVVDLEEDLNLTKEESDLLWELPPSEGEVDKRIRDLFMQTDLSARELQKRLFRIHQHARTVFEEQGYNVLYLALGFLEWKEITGDVHRAPLILIPVQLERRGVGGAFKLSWNGEDLITNISLQAKLQEQYITIPDLAMPHHTEGITQYLEEVEASIPTGEGWTVHRDVYLGFFSFTKFVMFQDLNPDNWPQDLSFDQNTIIKALFNPETQSTDEGFQEIDVDLKLKSRNVYTVLDADSSQIAVIEDVKHGKNLVVEGPPGTGKSQTIVNLIAELMASGKTVLFVSEKMAALQVVKSRLDSIGLGDFCLELHSHKSKKKEVLNELQRTLYQPPSPFIPMDDKFEELDEIRRDLNHYQELIHRPLPEMNFSPFQLYGMKEKSIEHFTLKGISLPRMVIANPSTYTREDWHGAVSTLKDLSQLLKFIKPLKDYPWRHAEPGVIFPADQEEIKKLLTDSLAIMGEIELGMEELSIHTGVYTPSNRDELNEIIDIARKISNSQTLPLSIINNQDWNEEKAREIINFLERFLATTSKFQKKALKMDLKGEMESFKKQGKELLLVPSPVFKDYEGEIKTSLNNLTILLDNLKSEINNLVDITGLKKPQNRKELEETLEEARLIASAPPVEKALLENENWNSASPEAKKIIRELREYRKKIKMLDNFQKNVLNHDLGVLLQEFTSASHKRLKFLSGDYKKTKNNISLLYLKEAPQDDQRIQDDLETLLRLQDLRNSLQGSQDTAKFLFGQAWNGEDTDPQFLCDLADWLIRFRKLLLAGELTDQALLKFKKGPNPRIKGNVTQIRDDLDEINDITQNLKGFIPLKTGELNFKQLKVDVASFKNKVDRYFQLKEKITGLYQEDAPDDDELILSDLKEILATEDLKNTLKESEKTARNLFGEVWQQEDTDLESLLEIFDWIMELKILQEQGKITLKTLEIISQKPNIEAINRTIENLQSTYDDFLKVLKYLDEYLQLNCPELFPNGFSRTLFSTIKSQLTLFRKEVPQLLTWSQFLSQMRELPPLAQPILELIEEDLLDSEDLLPCLEGNYADNMLRQAFMDDPALQNFVGDLHQNKIRQFIELDQELLKLNRERISHQLSETRPNVYTNLTPTSELGILLSELNRKRRHMPIRRLLLAAGGLIQTIKPCFMMSPLSVAQFMDPYGAPNLSFDVVIFDEASQVKPEDALGALLRGRQLVVMGDTKQLPPTTFFDIIIHPLGEGDYELDSLMDMESILHLCKRSFPIKMLRWHYRSRHESLIAVSNQEFYNNHLLVYPSPCHNSDKLGLKYMPLDRDIATYDRGRTSTNLEEAKAVVQAAFDHFQEYGDEKSLGIGTFNVNQQQAILEVLELELKRHPRARKFHKHFYGEREEKFFVKNLETIQGDERDVIYVSVGYGFDEEGKLTHNFGPLNKDGGERRLNVLVTRAKEKCMVFANFHAGDLKNVTEGSAFGLRALKTFIEYAEHRNLESLDSSLQTTSSPFEESIKQVLEKEGLKVDRQVGCAGYRLDLAVIDPEEPGRYILGIECDGVMYHSAPVARDRDRLRQQVLEGLGWNIYRIWSTDWYRNREESIKRLLQSITDAQEGKIKSELPVVEEEVVEEVMDETPEPTPEVNLEDMIPAYEVCSDLGLNKDKPLHEKLPQEVAPAMRKVVDLEGPIQVNELFKRIRTHWGLKRSGRRIKETLDSSLDLALNKGLFTRQDDFLFSRDAEIKVRRRGGDLPARIELISDEEIKQAVLLVIESQYATYPEELITQVARLFGFKSTRQATRERVNHILRQYLEKGDLVAMPNGMINFPKVD
ncbi:MAG TPA: DUF3320 domain-containing protein [Methanobacteriaceae archaeon]|nr:DUF3320 domain-containing protein [Methanobacteriaceae archaeon]